MTAPTEDPVDELALRRARARDGAQPQLVGTIEAARLLGVGRNTPARWELRYGFPRSRRRGRRQLWAREEIVALADALHQGLAADAAILFARATLDRADSALAAILRGGDLAGADETMEQAVALRGMEGAAGAILLPALAKLIADHGPHSIQVDLGLEWATVWLGRMRHLSPHRVGDGHVLVADATERPHDPERLYGRALGLALARRGLHPLPAGVHASDGAELVAHRMPVAGIVVAGRGVDDRAVARWLRRVRAAFGGPPVWRYRGGPSAGPSALSDDPFSAADEIVRHLRPVRELG